MSVCPVLKTYNIKFYSGFDDIFWSPIGIFSIKNNQGGFHCTCDISIRISSRITERLFLPYQELMRHKHKHSVSTKKTTLFADFLIRLCCVFSSYQGQPPEKVFSFYLFLYLCRCCSHQLILTLMLLVKIKVCEFFYQSNSR